MRTENKGGVGVGWVVLVVWNTIFGEEGEQYVQLDDEASDWLNRWLSRYLD